MKQLKETLGQQVQVQEKTETMQKVVLGVGMICAFISLVNFAILFGVGAKSLGDKLARQDLAWNFPKIESIPVIIFGNKPDNGVEIPKISGKQNKPLLENNNISFHPGWPVALNVFTSNVWPGQVAPAVEDLNNDGRKEMVITVQGSGTVDNPSKLFILDDSGNILVQSNWPGCVFDPLSVPAIEDIDNDNSKEIIIGCNNLQYPQFIYVLNSNGNLLRQIPTNYGIISDLHPTFLVKDINRDGLKEIVYIGWEGLSNAGIYLFAVDNHGNNLNGFPIHLEDINFAGASAPVVADLNGDRMLEIVVSSHLNLTPQQTSPHKIRAYNYRGELLWQQIHDSYIWESLAAGDVNNDGFDEIVGSADNGLYILNNRGEYIFQFATSQNYMTAPALGDLDLDGDLEIAFGNGENIYVMHHNGQIIYTRQLLDNVGYSTPVISDINNDHKPDVVFGMWYTVYAWDAQGNPIQDFPLTINHQALSVLPTIDDIDNNGDIELILSSSSYWVSDQPVVYVWDLNGNNNGYEWPMFAHDVRHTGNYLSPQ